MSGRVIQLGRQLRKLRHIVGGSPPADPATTLRRATQLACDLACEHAAVDDAQAAFHDLSVRGILEPALAERLAAWVASKGTDVTWAVSNPDDASGARALQIGRDLDRFLRSVELGTSAAELPFGAIVAREDAATTKPDSTAAVAISGRILELEVREGLASVAIDGQPILLTLDATGPVTTFALAAAPTTRAEVHRDPTGVTRVTWTVEHVTIELAPDFTRARVDNAVGD